MESDLNNIKLEESNTEKILNLFGEAADYINILRDMKFDENDLNVKESDFIEKSFNEKLRNLLKTKDAFSNTIVIAQVLDEIILSINYALNNNKSLDEKKAKKIIKKIENLSKKETSIHIDSFLTQVDGKEINNFFGSIKEYSFFAIDKIDDKKKYTLIVESTFCLDSQISKKVNQIKKSFLFFSQLHKIYQQYPDYIKNYYSYFVRKYIFRQKVEKNQYRFEDKLLDLNQYGNYVFIIITNKTLKTFEEKEYLVEKYSYNEDSPDQSIKKNFEKEDEYNENYINPIDNMPNKITLQSTSSDKDKIHKKKNEKVSHEPTISKNYKDLNNLVNNINQENNCAFKIIYINTYLNLAMPKCELEKEIQIIAKMQNVLVKFLSAKFPDFKISELIDMDNSNN